MIYWDRGMCYNANQCCDEERCYCNDYYEKANKVLSLRFSGSPADLIRYLIRKEIELK